MLLTVALLAQLTIVATATDTVPVDGYAEVQVRVTARGNRVPDVTSPGFPAFLVLRSQSSQHLQSDGKGARMVTELQYTLVPTREGRFTVPPFVARAAREVARSRPLTIVVRGGAAASRAPPPVPAIVARAPLDSSDPVSFHALAVPETVYVGQQSTYQLAVFLDASARSRVRRLEAIAPEMPGLLAYDPPGGMEEFERTGPGGINYEAHVYQRPVFPLTAGPITIPPARLTYAIPVSPSFFSREEHREIQSPPVTIVAIDPPAENRPPDYDGAVGALRISARLDSAGRVGEPLSLRVTLAGAGNVKLWPRPRVDATWAHVVLFQDRVRLRPEAQTVQGEKEFEFLLTPQREGTVVLPPVRYPYWNPVTEEYQVAETQPETLQVNPGRLARSDRVEQPGARLELRRVYRGPLPQPWHERPVVWGLLAAIPLPALALAVVRRPRRRRTALRARPATLSDLRRAPEDADPARVRRALARAVRIRLALPGSSSADPEALARAARRDGVTPETAAQLRTLLTALEREAFSGGREAAELRVREAWRIFAAIDREARYHPRVRSPRMHMILIFALIAAAGAGSARAALISSPGDAETDFARGVEEYESGQFAESQRAFGAAARMERRAPDAWANLGTAAWAAGDTARAVQGWMRALALEPSAGDARDRLGLTPAGRDLEWRVPRASPDMLLAAGALLWLAGWAWLAYRFHKRRRADGPAIVGICVAVVLFAMIRPLDQRLAARDRAVVASDTPVRSAPRLSTQRSSVARTGEVVKVLGRDGVWTRVAIEDSRGGWMPSSVLLSLQRD